MKSGIIDEFWSQARYGLQDFNQVSGGAYPNISNCIVTNPGQLLTRISDLLLRMPYRLIPPQRSLMPPECGQLLRYGLRAMRPFAKRNHLHEEF
jgi:hypothetical protein